MPDDEAIIQAAFDAMAADEVANPIAAAIAAAWNGQALDQEVIARALSEISVTAGAS